MPIIREDNPNPKAIMVGNQHLRKIMLGKETVWQKPRLWLETIDYRRVKLVATIRKGNMRLPMFFFNDEYPPNDFDYHKMLTFIAHERMVDHVQDFTFDANFQEFMFNTFDPNFEQKFSFATYDPDYRQDFQFETFDPDAIHEFVFETFDPDYKQEFRFETMPPPIVPYEQEFKFMASRMGRRDFTKSIIIEIPPEPHVGIVYLSANPPHGTLSWSFSRVRWNTGGPMYPFHAAVITEAPPQSSAQHHFNVQCRMDLPSQVTTTTQLIGYSNNTIQGAVLSTIRHIFDLGLFGSPKTTEIYRILDATPENVYYPTIEQLFGYTKITHIIVAVVPPTKLNGGFPLN